MYLINLEMNSIVAVYSIRREGSADIIETVEEI